MSLEILKLNKITKSFGQGNQALKVITDATFSMKQGEIVSLVGPSGGGKSTLLQIIGLLDNPDSGMIVINDTDCSTNDDHLRTKMRRDNIGFVYQFHHLLPEFNALENVQMPLIIKGHSKEQAQEYATEILEKVGLAERMQHMPGELSGGQQQRVAIARAIVGRPSLVLADEPTGNLDMNNSNMIFELLLKMIEDYRLSALIVTHNESFAKRTKRRLTISDHGVVGEL